MKYGSVCSGIEAATAAWHSLGWHPQWFAEIAPFPCAVLAHHFPEVPNLGDFTLIHASAPAIDLLVGGTPCQSFSVAGLRGGLGDARGGLALEFLRLADRTRPRWLVWENVPGVLSSDKGRAFGSILGGLVELGYGFAYRVLDAQYFGVPQRRRRVFVVGHLGDWRAAAAVLFERSSLRGDPAPSRKAAQDVAGCLGAGPAGGGWRSDADRMTFVARPLLGQAQPSHREDSDTYVAHTLRGTGFDASEDGTGRGTPLAVHVTQDPAKGDVFPALPSEHSGALGVAYAFAENSRAEVRLEGGDGAVAGALKAGGGKAGQGYPAILERSNVRRLTPRECERLQGFPDDWTLVPYRGKPALDGPRYQALGNSMAVPVMAWIGHRIDVVEKIRCAA